MLLVFNFCSDRQMFIINANIALYSGLNYVNYLNIIKSDHVSATVRTRLHLASGWSLDHSGA